MEGVQYNRDWTYVPQCRLTDWTATLLITCLYALENVAINDVLPIEAARRDAIANSKCFGGPGTPMA